MRGLFTLLLLLPIVALAHTASLRQTEIYVGDIAELEITYESAIPSMYAIDTTALEANFIVLETRSRVSRIRRDGQSAHRTQWVAQLVPRHRGELRIPPLQYGSHWSEALELSVTPAPEPVQALQSVFVETDAIPDNPLPGQQTRIVTRLYANLPLTSGLLGEPDTDLQLYRSGREARYSEERNGVRYRVLERSVLLTPEAPGELPIQGARFNGSVVAVDRLGNPLAEDARRFLFRSGNALRLQVRDLPSAFDGAHWLPANHVELKIEWEDRNIRLEPGDTLNLVLDLQASGLPAEVLPADLLARDSEGYRIFADQETRKTRVTGAVGDEFILGHLRQRYAILLDVPGEITLPALQLQWWDVVQNRVRTARVEATTLKVSAPAPGDAVARPRELAAAADRAPAYELLVQLGQDAWAWLSAAALSLLLLFLAWRKRDDFQNACLRARGRRQSRMRLLAACAANDAPAARRELIGWGRAHWRDDGISSLRQIADRAGQAGWNEVLEQLDAAVFAGVARDWRGDGLALLVEQQGRVGKAARTPRDAGLPDPYGA